MTLSVLKLTVKKRKQNTLYSFPSAVICSQSQSLRLEGTSCFIQSVFPHSNLETTESFLMKSLSENRIQLNINFFAETSFPMTLYFSFLKGVFFFPIHFQGEPQWFLEFLKLCCFFCFISPLSSCLPTLATWKTKSVSDSNVLC